MRIRTVFLALVLLAAPVCAGIYLAGSAAYRNPGPLAAEKIIYIPPGKSTLSIAENLASQSVFDDRDALIFKIAVRLSGAKLKAGEYAFEPGISIEGAVLLLQSGKTYQRKITIPEGLMSFEIVALVNGAETMTGEIKDIPPEGSLLPETYSYSHGDSRANLMGRMQKAMNETIGALWPLKEEGLPLQTPQDAVTLASIVEKETGVETERARVAGVFINRLRKGMSLQSDPTVIYALTMGKIKLERALTRNDLNTDSPYNTYKIGGLPPAPIANPGREALLAVLHPENNPYLYFVADGSGGHAFAATLDAHTRNVGKWRQIQKESR